MTASSAPLAAETTAAGRWRVVADHIALTKPRIVELLLITTVPAMIAAAGGWPGAALLAATVTGGAFVSGSAHAVNMVIDRDIDAKMRRTAHRPLPSGRVSPRSALTFAAGLLIAGTVALYMIAGTLAAALTFGAWAWYVGLYTCWLKRRTPQNIVVGGAAGAAPPLIGWAAVTGEVGLPAIAMFVVVVSWTPIHFWALAIGTGSDYGQAGVPMLPIVAGPKRAAQHGAGYAVATALATLAVPASGVGGIPLAVALAAGGAWFVARAFALVADPSPSRAWRTFHSSNAYLAGVFIAIGIAGFFT